MKWMRVSLLVLALSVCAYAGDMPNMATGTPPPPPPTSAAITVEIASDVLQSVLSLF